MSGPSSRCSWRGATLVSVLLSSLLIGCSTKDQPEVPVAAKIGNPRAVFLGNASGGTSAPTGALSATASTLLELDQVGVIQNVPFIDENGKVVNVEVDALVALSPEYLLLRITPAASHRAVVVLLRVSDGVLFDMTAVCGGNADGSRAMIKGNYLYVLGYDGAVTRIDLGSMVGTPMNNPTYAPVSAPFLVDHDGNVRAFVPVSSGNNERILHADNSPPSWDQTGSPSDLVHNCQTDAYASRPALAGVYGEDGHFYAVCSATIEHDHVLDPGGITTVQYFVREYVSFVPYMTVVDGPPVRSVDFFSEGAVLPATSYGLFTRSRYLPLSSGFFTMSGVPGGGISLEWTPKDLSGLAGNYDPVISGEYGYWRSGDYIFRIRFDADSPSELVVTTPNLIGWNVVGGAVLFTKFLSGTNVGTFRVSTPGATPELVLSSDMAVREIVEW